MLSVLCVYVMLVGHAFQTNPHEHNGENAAHEHKGHEKTLSNMRPCTMAPYRVPSRPTLRNPPRPEMNLSSNDAAIQRPGQSAQPPCTSAAAAAAASQSTRARVNGTRRARARCIRLSTKPPAPPPRRWKLFPQFTTTTDEQRTGAGAYNITPKDVQNHSYCCVDVAAAAARDVTTLQLQHPEPATNTNTIYYRTREKHNTTQQQAVLCAHVRWSVCYGRSFLYGCCCLYYVVLCVRVR